MTKYIKRHERYILNAIEEGLITEELLNYHSQQIRHLQHERFVHLIVMALFGLILTMIFIGLMLRPMVLIGLLLLIVGVVEGFYIAHYYRLENTVQRWYLIENSLIKKLKGMGTNLYQ
jgi:uncharacterized membrane protein